MPPKNYQKCKYCGRWSSSIQQSYERTETNRATTIRRLKQPLSCKRRCCAHCGKPFGEMVK